MNKVVREAEGEPRVCAAEIFIRRRASHILPGHDSERSSLATAGGIPNVNDCSMHGLCT
jgi:hypothetical protein